MSENSAIRADEVPTMPDDARLVDSYCGMKVYDLGYERWRFDRKGQLLTYIKYKPNYKYDGTGDGGPFVCLWTSK